MLKKIVLLVSIIFIIIVSKKAFFYEKPDILPENMIIQPALTVKELIKVKGIQYDVSQELMKEIINCESSGSTTIQSKHIYKTNKYGPINTREQSYGLVQIHLPAHPDITKEQAIDPEFSIDFLAKNLSQGKGKMWSCYPIALKKIN